MKPKITNEQREAIVREAMTDLELLEAAAKAAGWKSRPSVSRPSRIVVEVEPDSWTFWNPLDDDGDAFRLAVRMDMVVTVNSEAHDPDPYAATRRAIVRAAAEMGEQA